jgi:hypothetical protein
VRYGSRNMKLTAHLQVLSTDQKIIAARNEKCACIRFPGRIRLATISPWRIRREHLLTAGYSNPLGIFSLRVLVEHSVAPTSSPAHSQQSPAQRQTRLPPLWDHLVICG